MTQTERTEAAIAAIQDSMDPGYVKRQQIGELALDLARRLDAIMRVLRAEDISYGAMSEIRRIYDEGDTNAQA